MSLSAVEATTAPGPRLDLDHLSAEARRLWHDEPVVDLPRRQALRAELADLDGALERLSLRASWAGLDTADLEELDDCVQHLDALRGHWRPVA